MVSAGSGPVVTPVLAYVEDAIYVVDVATRATSKVANHASTVKWFADDILAVEL